MILANAFRRPTNQEDLNFNHLVRDRFWFGLASASTGFLAIFALRVGATPQQLSLMASLPGMMTFIATFFSVPWRKRYSTSASAQVLPSFMAMLIYLLPAFTPLWPLRWQPLWLLFSVSFPAFGEGMAIGIRLAVIRESISETWITTFLSRRQTIMKLMGAIGAASLGIWLERIPYPLNYQGMYALAWCCSLLSFWNVSQTKPLFPQPVPPASNWQAWRDPKFLRASILVLAVFSSYGTVQALIPARLVDELNANEGFIAAYGLFDLIAGTLAAALTVYIVPRLGNRIMAGVAMLLTALALGIIALTPYLSLTLVAAVLVGIGWTVADLGQFGYFLAQIPSENSTYYTAPYMQLLAISGFISPLLGGFLVELGLTLSAVLLVGAALRVLAALIIFSLKNKPA